jgi:hypothetical protein
VCHAAESGHFAGLCSTCHDTSGWTITNFDHSAGAGYACLDCHEQPDGHYTNTTCQNCHDTENWGQVTFDHSGLTDCIVCHGIDDHYHTGCSSCHNTDDWSQATFDHTGYTDCISCHTQEEHYTDNCEACHKTTTWEPIFDHSDGADCQSCHTTPDGHWPGACSDCHTVTDWTDYTFNHDGYTNCKACHSQDRPADHPRGQCDRCHTTDTWTPPPTVILAAGVLTPTATTAVTATVTVEPTQILTTTAVAQATPTVQPTEFLITRRGVIPLPIVPNGVLPPRPEPGQPGEEPIATVQPNPRLLPTAPPVEEQPAQRPQITPTPLHPFRRALPPVGPAGNAGLPTDKTHPLPARAPVPDVQPMALPPEVPDPSEEKEALDLDRPRGRAADVADEDVSEEIQPP